MKTQIHLSLCIAALACMPPGCSQPAHGAVSSATPVKVQRVEVTPKSASTRYSGTLEPAIRVEAAFKVGGYVEMIGQVSTPGGRRALDKGDYVTKGTVLARVRTADYAQRVATADTQVIDARARAQLAISDLERSKKLFALGAITQAQLDSYVSRADSAKAQVESALAHTAEAQLSLGDTVLRAPLDGVILSRHTEVGTLMSPGQPAITLADTRSMKAVFGAPQSLVEQLRLGSPLQVFVGAEGEAKAPDKLLGARVTRIAPAADSNGRLFAVEAALPNTHGDLRPGAVVAVHVPDAATSGEALLVPLSAVLRSPRDPQAFSVFVLDGEGDRAVARLHDVRLGRVIGNSVSVESGLDGAERVVTIGNSLLRDGSPTVVIR